MAISLCTSWSGFLSVDGTGLFPLAGGGPGNIMVFLGGDDRMGDFCVALCMSWASCLLPAFQATG